MDFQADRASPKFNLTPNTDIRRSAGVGGGGGPTRHAMAASAPRHHTPGSSEGRSALTQVSTARHMLPHSCLSHSGKGGGEIQPGEFQPDTLTRGSPFEPRLDCAPQGEGLCHFTLAGTSKGWLGTQLRDRGEVTCPACGQGTAAPSCARRC